MRILIVRLGAFGDIIHTLPLAADLYRAGHTIDWLCEDRWRVLLDGHPWIRQVITVPRWRKGADRPRLNQRMNRHRLIARRLQAERYDVAIDAQGLAKSAWWSLRSGARNRISHQRPRAREGAWLVAQRRAPCTATHVIDQQRALSLALPPAPQRSSTKQLGLNQPFRAGPADAADPNTATGGWQFAVPAWSSEHVWAAQWMQQQHLVLPDALNVGAGWPSKVWPETHQREWCERTVAAGRSGLLLWGSPAELQLAQRLHQTVPGTVLAPPTTIPQLAALLNLVGLLVSGDTGPLHLARALGTPAVGLFGPVPATRNGPRGHRWTCLQADGAAWERRDAARGGMAQLSVDAVLAASTSLRRSS